MPFDERLIVMRLAHDDKILSPALYRSTSRKIRFRGAGR
jgi:hypothetical protein